MLVCLHKPCVPVQVALHSVLAHVKFRWVVAKRLVVPRGVYVFGSVLAGHTVCYLCRMLNDLCCFYSPDSLQSAC